MSATRVFFDAAWIKVMPALLHVKEHETVLSLCSVILRRPARGWKKERAEVKECLSRGIWSDATGW
jgi:hypothetical protein